MPPSGFSHASVQGAATFVRGCFDDLLAEIQSGKHLSLRDGLAFEVSQIDHALATSDCGDMERGSLLLVKQCYSNALELCRNDDALTDEQIIDVVVNKLSTKLVRLHITPDGRLIERDM